MAEEALLVMTTFGSVEEARKVVRTLLDERLIVCGNLLPGVESIYRWMANVETSAEVQVILKTNQSRYWLLEARLLELHSYEVPEVIAIPVQAGSWNYLRWVNEGCSPEG